MTPVDQSIENDQIHARTLPGCQQTNQDLDNLIRIML